MRRVLSPNQRPWVISLLLVALVARALIPAGFMPATDRPLSFQICPDGFPAALLKGASEAAAAPLGAGTDGAAALAGEGMLMHAGHHHDGGALPHTGDDGAMAHAGHHHQVDAPLPVTHHHDGPLHNHSVAGGEHCVFAAVAGVFALAFAATFFAPAATISAPDVEYLAPVSESRRFRIPQPRGPPALS